MKYIYYWLSQILLKTKPTQLQYQMSDWNEQIFQIYSSIYKCVVFLFMNKS